MNSLKLFIVKDTEPLYREIKIANNYSFKPLL